MKKTTSFLVFLVLLAALLAICALRFLKPLDHSAPTETAQTESAAAESTVPTESAEPAGLSGPVFPSPTAESRAAPTPSPTPEHRRWNATPAPATPEPTPMYESLTEEQFVEKYGGESERVDEYVVEVSESEVFTIH